MRFKVHTQYSLINKHLYCPEDDEKMGKWLGRTNFYSFYYSVFYQSFQNVLTSTNKVFIG